MAFDDEITIRIPAPSDGIETVLVLFGIGAILTIILGALQHRERVAKVLSWLSKHPWENASKPANLLSWGAVAIIGPFAAILFVLAVNEAFALLANEGGSEAGAGSLGRGAVIVALISAPFVIWRSVVAQKTVNVTEQGHITDRINAAVEGLGSEKTVKLPGEDEKTAPSLEVRIGALYALERISQDSERDHIQIMEILCAYIRQNAGRDDLPLPDGAPTPDEWTEWAQEGRAHPRLDVDVALRVIERRGADRKQREKDKNYRLGLERAPLRRIVLSYRDLTRADLQYAQLQGAILWSAQLQGANLVFAKLQAADLMGAKLQGADLMGAQLQGADLRLVELDGDTSLTAPNLRGAAVSSVNFTNIPQIVKHLQHMFGDGSVTLPEGVKAPAHWPKDMLDFDDFKKQWRAWQKTLDGQTPPDPPGDE